MPNIQTFTIICHPLHFEYDIAKDRNKQFRLMKLFLLEYDILGGDLALLSLLDTIDSRLLEHCPHLCFSPFPFPRISKEATQRIWSKVSHSVASCNETTPACLIDWLNTHPFTFSVFFQLPALTTLTLNEFSACNLEDRLRTRRIQRIEATSGSFLSASNESLPHLRHLTFNLPTVFNSATRFPRDALAIAGLFHRAPNLQTLDIRAQEKPIFTTVNTHGHLEVRWSSILIPTDTVMLLTQQYTLSSHHSQWRMILLARSLRKACWVHSALLPALVFVFLQNRILHTPHMTLPLTVHMFNTLSTFRPFLINMKLSPSHHLTDYISCNVMSPGPYQSSHSPHAPHSPSATQPSPL